MGFSSLHFKKKEWKAKVTVVLGKLVKDYLSQSVGLALLGVERKLFRKYTGS